jgi:hypothetical protein
LADKIEKDHWHPGFLGAMEIEFRAYRPNLIFDDEHSLSKEPLKMDLLIIQKDKDVIITNQIAEYAWIVNEVREKNLTKDKEGARRAIDQAIS